MNKMNWLVAATLAIPPVQEAVQSGHVGPLTEETSFVTQSMSSDDPALARPEGASLAADQWTIQPCSIQRRPLLVQKGTRKSAPKLSVRKSRRPPG